MVETKPIEYVVKKWQERASAAAEDYREGVRGKGGKWEANTVAAFDNWVKGIQDAISNRTFVGGVRAAGGAKWERMAVEKGAVNYPTGIRAATEEYRKAMAEVLNVLRGITLPERGPRGDPKNYERVKTIGDTLHKWAVERKRAK